MCGDNAVNFIRNFFRCFHCLEGIKTFILKCYVCLFYCTCDPNVQWYVLFGGDSKNRKPVGFRNNSNLCYLNSMVHSLASSDKFLGRLVQIRKNMGAHSSRLDNLIEVIQSTNDANSNVDSNTKKLESLVNQIDWNKQNQQDAFDFLSTLVNSIHNEFRTNLPDEKMPLKIKILHEVKGMDISNTIQDHLGLSVALCGDYSKPPGVRLDYLINESFLPTFIDDDPDKTSRMIISGDVPEILLIQIQANKLDRVTNELIKPEYYIIYDKELSLDLDIAIDMNGQTTHVKDVKYQLSAVIRHTGTIRGGHYVTYRNWRGRWYLVNDEDVTIVKFDKNICPYILIYEKSDHVVITTE